MHPQGNGASGSSGFSSMALCAHGVTGTRMVRALAVRRSGRSELARE